jgi:hypothetical protein
MVMARSWMLWCGLMLALGGMPACGSSDGNGNGTPDMGAPDAMAPINFSFEQLVEACVRLAACNVDRKPRLNDCVKNFYERYAYYGQRGLYERLYDCANKGKGSCKVIRECLGYASRPKNGDCDQSYATKCEGDVAHTCDLIVGGWIQALDCSKGGLKCAMRDTGSGKTAACTPGVCNSNLFVQECKDNKLLTCQGGAIQVDDCGAKQLQCRDPNVGLCEGTGRSCPQISAYCDGNTLVDCVQSYLSEIDCTKAFGKKMCDPASASCRGAGADCSTDSFFDTCEGDTLAVCIDGFKLKFDCKKMGFLGCETASTYGAYCQAEPVYD